MHVESQAASPLSHGHMLAVLGAGASALTFGSYGSIARAQTTVVKVGSGNAEANAQVFYAIDQGFFKKSGIAATNSDPTAIQPCIDLATKYKNIPRSFPTKEAYFSG